MRTWVGMVVAFVFGGGLMMSARSPASPQASHYEGGLDTQFTTADFGNASTNSTAFTDIADFESSNCANGSHRKGSGAGGRPFRSVLRDNCLFFHLPR